MPQAVGVYAVAANHGFKLIRVQKFLSQVNYAHACLVGIFQNFIVEHFLVTVNGVDVAFKKAQDVLPVANAVDNVLKI